MKPITSTFFLVEGLTPEGKMVPVAVAFCTQSAIELVAGLATQDLEHFYAFRILQCGDVVNRAPAQTHGSSAATN